MTAIGADFAADLVAALNEMTDVTRSETADTGSYRYKFATLDQATKLAREVLGKHKLAVQQWAHCDAPGSVSVTTTIWHASGESVEAPPLTMPTKAGPQDIGSAISYARRYALMAALGLATDDDDGARAQEAAERVEPPHPLSERVAAVTAEMRRLADTDKAAMKEWADGRKLSGAGLLADERWLEMVEAWLDENQNGAKS